MAERIRKPIFSTKYLAELADQMTEYARTDWPDCPGFTLEYNYLTRLYMLGVKDTKHNRAFSFTAVAEIVSGLRDPRYAIKDLQESVVAAQ